jgi:FkbM family methyltransferase
MANFYSQSGEDIVAFNALCNSRFPRFFVEVGMIDGRRYSNTLVFEELGWRGMCVEPLPEYAEMVRANRPGSYVFQAAASDRSDCDATFFADSTAELSGLKERDEQELKRSMGEWFKGFSTVQVPLRTLNQMLVECGAPVGFELLSIDVEGTEIDVLKGCDLKKWKPRVLLLEANSSDSFVELKSFLSAFGYKFARSVGHNVFFTRTLADLVRINLALIDQPRVHTGHPKEVDAKDVVFGPDNNHPSFVKRLLVSARRAVGI